VSVGVADDGADQVRDALQDVGVVVVMVARGGGALLHHREG
jgi:hypothetical protein